MAAETYSIDQSLTYVLRALHRYQTKTDTGTLLNRIKAPRDGDAI